MTFDDIAEAQGWGVESQLDVALSYIANQQDDDAWLDFAQQVADSENEST